MIKLSEEAKKVYAKYVGPDGRLIIDPSLPDKVKEAFEFFNNEGINILELNIDDEINTELDNDESVDTEEIEEDEDDDLEEFEEDTEDIEDDEEDSDEEDSNELELNKEVTETEQANLNDLNNMF